MQLAIYDSSGEANGQQGKMASSPHKANVQMKIGYVRDRTSVYKEKWDAAHPWCAHGSSAFAYSLPGERHVQMHAFGVEPRHASLFEGRKILIKFIIISSTA